MWLRNDVVAILAVGVLTAFTPDASAQQHVLLSADALETAVRESPVHAQQAQPPSPISARAYRGRERRPSWIMPVHVLTATMQTLDAHSTFKGIEVGATEANPLVRSFAHHRPAFLALKAGVAAGVILTTDRMAKRHPVRALITAAAINSVYAMVAAHNYKVARGLR